MLADASMQLILQILEAENYRLKNAARFHGNQQSGAARACVFKLHVKDEGNHAANSQQSRHTKE